MNARERFRVAADLFLEAGKLAPGEVDKFLDARCGPDNDLRMEVQALLDGRDVPNVFDGLVSRLRPIGDELRGHAAEPDGHSPVAFPSRGRDVEEAPGQIIDRFRLVELLGEGGFGRVWAAEQTEPVRRRVAIKILKAGMDSREVLARFEAERQALAFMDHPNIAKVFDAGMTEYGRPYFVMEHAPGMTITGFCSANRLRVRQRLELFIPVCRALQHAHQRGIIHRDLKPSNILVTIVDGRPAPKIIDFGIAKATATPLTELTLATLAGRLLGTPEYMSPEQAASTGADIDTRTDIYSLGVVLYQLLTDTLPFETSMLMAAGYERMIKVIREQDPPKPSTRLSMLMTESATPPGGVTPKAARNQGTEARAAQRELRGELDWLVMKCLEKNRDRRYESADALGADIQRYLDGEPIAAAPPSRTYQFKKMVRRHGLVIGAASAVLMALVVGLGVALYLYTLERDARQRAVAAEAESQTRANNLQRVADFQSQMLDQVDPTIAGIRLTEDVVARFGAALAKAGVPEDLRGDQVNEFAGEWGRVNATDAARELIDRTILRPAVEAIGKQFADQPAVGASLRHALAERYNELGMYEKALALARQAFETRRDLLGEDHPDTLMSMGSVASLLAATGKLAEAEPCCREALARSRRVLGEDHPQTLVMVAKMGRLLNRQGKRNDAEQFFSEAMEKRRRVLGEEDPATLASISAMADLRRNQGMLSEAEPLYREVLGKQRRVLGDDHLDTLTTLNNLAGLLKDLGKMPEAIAGLREVVERRRRIQGEAHPSTLAVIQSLGATLAADGQRREAEELMREALLNQRRLLGTDHPSVLTTQSNLAVFLIQQGDVVNAEPMCRDALARRRRVLGDDHPDTLVANNIMGFLLRRQNKAAEAEPYVRETLTIGRRILGPAHPDTLIYAHNLGVLLAELKRPAEAEPLLREVIDAGGPVLGKDNQLVLSAMSFLGAVLMDLNRAAEAVDLLAASETTARRALSGANERSLGMLLMNLGKARTTLGQFASAEAVTLDAHAIFVKIGGAGHKDTRACTRAIADLYSAWAAAVPSPEQQAKAEEWSAKLKALDAPTAAPR